MSWGIINLDRIKELGELVSHPLEKMLKANAIQVGILEKAAVPSEWCDNPIQPDHLARPLHHGNWLDGGGSETMPQQCLQANPGFILHPQAQGRSRMVGLNIG
jgi:hypothetical protein